MANTKITNPELFNLGANNTAATQLPVMTTTQRIAMTGLSVGEMIFNSTTDKVEYFDGTKWYGITYEASLPANLKMYLNAGDANSYNGTGTTWSDLTSNANNGALVNMTSANWNSGGYFDFNNSYVQLPNILTFGSSSYTISIWVNFDSLGLQQEIISSYNSSGNGFLIDHTGSDNIRYYNTGGTNLSIGSGNNTAIVGTWQLWTVTMDRSSATNVAKIYLGSVVKSSASGTNLGTTNGSNPQIGSYPGGNLYLDGKVSKARIYDTALTQSEIQALVTEGPV